MTDDLAPEPGADRLTRPSPQPLSRRAAWVEGARPRTLPAAVAPVAVGTGVAAVEGGAIWGRAALALVVALALQVGVNFANDYSDGVRGTDADRVGPPRLVAGGHAPPAQVRAAALASFAVAGIAGLALVLLSRQWWLLAVGVGCVAGAWYYTGGRRPYGYRGLGEVAVFLFFGVVAVVGTADVQTGRLTWFALASSVPVGLVAMCLLVVNNLRDRPRDAAAGKHTLAVRLGDAGTRRLYTGSLLLAFAVTAGLGLAHPGSWLGLAAGLMAVGPVRTVRDGADGADLIPVLGATGRLQLAYGLLVLVGLLVLG